VGRARKFNYLFRHDRLGVGVFGVKIDAPFKNIASPVLFGLQSFKRGDRFRNSVEPL